jgi:hypothetical protein
LPRFSHFLYWVNFLPKIRCFDGELPIYIFWSKGAHPKILVKWASTRNKSVLHQRVLVHRKIISPIIFDRTPFDRNTIIGRKPIDWMPFDRKLIWPKSHLAEHCSTEWTFYRSRSYYQKRLTERFVYLKKLKMVIWPKIKCENWVIWPKSHFGSKAFFREMVSWPETFFYKWPFDRKVTRAIRKLLLKVWLITSFRVWGLTKKLFHSVYRVSFVNL